jgi:hypothetical protein
MDAWKDICIRVGSVKYVNDSSKNIAVVKGFRPHCLLIWKNRINEK